MCFYIEMFQWRIWWQVFNLCQINKICGQKKGILSITCHYKTKQHAVYHHVTNFNKHGGNLFSASIHPNEKTFHLRLKMSCNLSAKVHCPVLKFPWCILAQCGWAGPSPHVHLHRVCFLQRCSSEIKTAFLSSVYNAHTHRDRFHRASAVWQPNYRVCQNETLTESQWHYLTHGEKDGQRERERDPSGPNEEQSQARWT